MSSQSVPLEQCNNDSHTTSGNLTYLEKPRFFCGQLLNDRDLMDLVNWTHNKIRLTRYRHGWGVVCGLDVRCDDKNPGHILMGPGYGISCCGDDIIVSEAASLDLSEVCLQGKDPCNPWETQSKHQIQPVEMVDLYIRYREEKTDPQPTLGRSNCNEADGCDFARTKETYELIWKPASSDDPVAACAESWHSAYKNCMKVLEEFCDNFLPVPQDTSNNDWENRVRRHLLNYLDQHPLHQFCFVRDWICSEGFASEDKLVEVFFWLVQDCRNAFLQCQCHACQDSDGIPLARVSLKPEPGSDGRTSCSVNCIDSYPPFQRPLQEDCWPAPLGHVNLGQFIWHREPEVCVKLKDLGIPVNRVEPFPLPSRLSKLKELLDCDLYAPCNQEICVQYLEVPDDTNCPSGHHVVGFCCVKEDPTPTSTELQAFKEGPREYRVDQTRPYQYVFTVRNTGPATANKVQAVDILDEGVEFVRQNQTFPPLLDESNSGAKTKLSWDLGDLTPGQQIQWSIVVNLDEVKKATVENCFQVQGANAKLAPDPCEPVITTIIRPVDPPILEPSKKALLASGKNIPNNQLILDEVRHFTYQFEIENKSNHEARDVIVNDAVAPELLVVCQSLQGEISERDPQKGTELIWNFSTIAANSKESWTVDVVVDQPVIKPTPVENFFTIQQANANNPIRSEATAIELVPERNFNFAVEDNDSLVIWRKTPRLISPGSTMGVEIFAKPKKALSAFNFFEERIPNGFQLAAGQLAWELEGLNACEPFIGRYELVTSPDAQIVEIAGIAQYEVKGTREPSEMTLHSKVTIGRGRSTDPAETGTPDDLSLIKGIGKARMQQLYDAGIYTFDQLAKTLKRTFEQTELAQSIPWKTFQQMKAQAKTLARQKREGKV